MQGKVQQMIDENRKFVNEIWKDAVKRVNKELKVSRKRADELRKAVTAEVEDITGKLQSQRGELEARGRELLGGNLDKAFEIAKQVESLVVDTTETALQRVAPVVDSNVPFLSKYVSQAKDVLRKADSEFDKLQNNLKKVLAPAGAAGASPIEGYDGLTVKDVVEKAKTLSTDGVKAVKAYEESHKNRVTIIRELDTILGQAA